MVFPRGSKQSPEARARMSASQIQRWAKIKDALHYQAEHEAIHTAHPRCEADEPTHSFFDHFKQWFEKEVK